MSNQGPLPTVDAKSVLQERSIRALQAALPPDEYIFRDERRDDYGVDGAIELLIGQNATNIRAQVQLKGRSNTSVGKNGAVAVQVSTANLNYLLNGICPIYILFRPESNELRFALARDEWSRIEGENKEWRRQESITIHFVRVLNSDSLAELRQSIASEAAVRRAVDERLNGLRPNAGHVVMVDAQSLEVTDSQQILRALAQVGNTLTSSGFATAVVNRARVVPMGMLLAVPLAALAVAYAHFHLAHYYEASTAIRQLLLTNPDLDAENRSLLDLLYLSTRRMLGEIGEEDYERAMRAWTADAPEDLVLQYDISRAWSHYSNALAKLIPESERQALKESVRAALKRARRLNHQAVLDHVEFHELMLEAHELEDGSLDARALGGLAARGIGDAYSVRERQRAILDSKKQWLNRVKTLADKTRASRSTTYCHLLLLLNHVMLADERQRRYAAWAQGHEEHGDIAPLIIAARECVSIARQFEDRDLELSASIALADALDTSGAEDEATAVAREALRMAELCGSVIYVRQLKTFLGGAERMAARKREILEISNRSEEEVIRDAPDELVQFMAGAMISANQLPESRLPNVLFSLQCQRQLARERRDWCRHIALAERRANNETALTMYIERPLLKIVCVERQKEALVRSSNPAQISKEFRNLHCVRCAHRAPDAPAQDPKPTEGDHQGRASRNKAKAERRRRRLSR